MRNIEEFCYFIDYQIVVRFVNPKHNKKMKRFEGEIPSYGTKKPAIGCKLGLKSMHIKR